MLNGGPRNPISVTTDVNGNVWADGMNYRRGVVGFWRRGGTGAFHSVPIALGVSKRTIYIGNRIAWFALGYKQLDVITSTNHLGVAKVFAISDNDLLEVLKSSTEVSPSVATYPASLR